MSTSDDLLISNSSCTEKLLLAKLELDTALLINYLLSRSSDILPITYDRADQSAARRTTANGLVFTGRLEDSFVAGTLGAGRCLARCVCYSQALSTFELAVHLELVVE